MTDWSMMFIISMSEEKPSAFRVVHNCNMVENGKKHRQNSHLIIRFPTSEGVSEVSERANE